MKASPFGAALRQARIERGLTQAELGAPKFSRSYVSLLESGTRQPTREVIQHMADKLARPAAELEMWDASGAELEGLALAALQVESVFRLAAHSRAEARALILDLEQDARPDSPLGEMSRSLAVIFSDTAVPVPDSLASLAELMEHRTAQGSPVIYAYVLEQRCYLLRSIGRLNEAVDLARQGLMKLRGMAAGSSAVTPILLSLVAALAELGATSQAIALRGDLAAALEGNLLPEVEGNGRWTLGNLLFMQGDAQAGALEHERATRLIDPASHLRQWARLQRASASMRLEHEAELELVPELIDRADRAFSISADATDVLELDIVRARYLLWGGAAADAWRVVGPVARDGEGLSPQDRAQAHEVAGRALAELDRRAEAVEHFRAAASIYQSIQAYERALTLCAQWGFAPSAA